MAGPALFTVGEVASITVSLDTDAATDNTLLSIVAITQDLDLAASAECMVAIPGGGEPLRETILSVDDEFLEVPLLGPKDVAIEYHGKFMKELEAGIKQLEEDIRLPLIDQIERKRR